MQELIPINEHGIVVYDHETEEYFSMMNIIELSMIISKEMKEILDPTKRENITMKITTTPTHKQLTNLRERIVKIVEDEFVEIYIMNDCIKIQLPAKVGTDQLQQIDEIFDMNGTIETHPRSHYSILEYKVEK